MIYFKVDFNQYFLAYTGNLVTSAKFLGSRTNYDTSDIDSPKVGNELFI